MLLLAFRNLRARPARTFFTAFAIALGVALIFAMRIVGVAVEQQARAAREGRLAGADLEVVSANGATLSDHLADELTARPEVALAAPIYRNREGRPTVNGLSVTYEGTGLSLLGVAPARTLTPYELAAGDFFSEPDAYQVLLPISWAAQHGFGVGDDVSLTTDTQTRDYTVVGLLKEKNLPGSSPTAWLPLQTMQAAFGAPGAATSVYVQLKPNQSLTSARDTLQEAIGAQYFILSAADKPPSGNDLTRALQVASLALLLSAAFFVFNAFAITLAQRRREIGQLRALGMTRPQVLAQTLTESFLTALLGSLIGLPLGWLLGRGLLGTSVTGYPFPLDGAATGVAVGVLVTLAVTFNIAWNASRVSPLEALGKGGSQTRPYGNIYERWGWLGALMGLGLYLFAHFQVVQATKNKLDYNVVLNLSYQLPLALVLIVLLALPSAVCGVLWAFERFASRLGAVAQLAAGSLLRNRSRAMLTTATLVVGMTIVVMLAGIVLAVKESLDQGDLIDFIAKDFILVRPPTVEIVAERFTGSNVASSPPLPPGLQSRLDELEQQGQADVYAMGAFALPGYTSLDWALAADLDLVRGTTTFRPLMGSWDEADRSFAAGPAVILPEVIARREGLKPGDTIEVDTVKGKVKFTVAMVSGLTAIVSRDIGEEYFDAHPGYFLVNARPGTNKDALRKEVQSISRDYGMIFSDDALTGFLGPVRQGLDAALNLFGGLTSLSGIVAALALVNTLIASVLERQRELGTLRAVGMSQGQVRGMVVVEAGLLGLTGSFIGALGGLAASFAFGQLLNVVFSTQFGVPLTKTPPLPWTTALAALATGSVISMLAALYPADRAANVNPAEAMRAEGATGFLPPAKHLGPTGLRGLVARMPLAAKLSFTVGVIFVLTMTVTTLVRLTYERRLVEDNMRSIIARGFDVLTSADEFKPDLDALTPEVIAQLQAQAGLQADTLQAQFRAGETTPYDFTLLYLFVADDKDKVLLSNRAEYTSRTLTDTVAFVGSSSIVRLTEWTGDRAFEIALPIENKAGRRIGSVRLGFSAQPVDNITRDIVRSSIWTMAAALAVAVILTILFTRRALAPMAQVVNAARAVARGDLARRVPESRWDDAGQLARAFNDMVRGLNDRERMRDLFGRYLSREVGEAVPAGRVSLKGERKTITCLYVDMRGSTTFAESHAPEDVMAALNEYFEVIILATEAHGGIVNRFVGDEAVCVFGAPTEYRDHADRAVQAALAMREGLAYVNQKRAALGQSVLNFGIGLNTGEVTAGATGSEERQEYTVIGDAMNVGARIQGLTKNFPEHDVLLSEFTHAALGPKAEAYEVADLGPVEIRGKTQAVRVFGLIGRQE